MRLGHGMGPTWLWVRWLQQRAWCGVGRHASRALRRGVWGWWLPVRRRRQAACCKGGGQVARARPDSVREACGLTK